MPFARLELRPARTDLGDRQRDLVVRDGIDEAAHFAVVEPDSLPQLRPGERFGEGASDDMHPALGHCGRLKRPGEHDLVALVHSGELFDAWQFTDDGDVHLVGLRIPMDEVEAGREVGGLFGGDQTAIADDAHDAPVTQGPSAVDDFELVMHVAAFTPPLIDQRDDGGRVVADVQGDRRVDGR